MALIDHMGSDAVTERWTAVSAERDRLLRIARARLNSEEDAQDCVQEAMLRCVEFDHLDVERMSQFLTTVTVRLCADYYRGRRRAERLASRLAAAPSSEPSHEETLCDRAEAAWLASVLRDLPPRQQEIAFARADGASCHALASRLGVPYTTVESALARVRRSLRTAREATLGLLVVPRGWRWLLAGGTAATVAALNLVVPVLGDAVPRRPQVPARPAAAPPPSELPGVRVDAGDVLPLRDARRAAPAARVVAAGPAAVPATAGEGQYSSGVDPSGGPGLGIGEQPPTEDYGPLDRARHCLEYGVHVAPRTDCGYPPGDPRNDFHKDSIRIGPPGDLS